MESNRLPNIVYSVKAEPISESHVAKVTSVKVIKTESSTVSKNKIKTFVVQK